LFKILDAYNIPERLIDAIMLIYKELKAKVVSPDEDADYLKFLLGLCNVTP